MDSGSCPFFYVTRMSYECAVELYRNKANGKLHFWTKRRSI